MTVDDGAESSLRSGFGSWLLPGAVAFAAEDESPNIRAGRSKFGPLASTASAPAGADGVGESEDECRAGGPAEQYGDVEAPLVVAAIGCCPVRAPG